MKFSATAFCAFSIFALAQAGVMAQDDPETRSPYENVRTREASGYHNGIFDEVFREMKTRLPPARRGDDELGLNARVFLGSQRMIVDRSRLETAMAPGPMVDAGAGSRVPARIFEIFHDEVKKTLMARLQLSETEAGACASALELAAVAQAGVNYDAYLEAIGRSRPTAEDRKSNAARAMESVFLSSRVLNGCDIPYLAGYPESGGETVYVARMLPLNFRVRGRAVPVAALLSVHERVEKAMLDEFGLSYPHAHQIALRIEHTSALAIGAFWKEYDRFITRASKRMDGARLSRVPIDLDLTPYLTWTDIDSLQLVSAMNAARVTADKCN